MSVMSTLIAFSKRAPSSLFPLRFSPDELPSPLPDLLQADDVEGFVVEYPVQGVAIVGEGKLRRWGGEKSLKRGSSSTCCSPFLQNGSQ